MKSLKRNLLALILLPLMLLASCDPTTVEDSFKDATKDGWEEEDAEAMFDVLGAYIPHPGKDITRFEFQDDFYDSKTISYHSFYFPAIYFTFSITNGEVWMENYHQTLIKHKFASVSKNNGGPKSYYNMYHNLRGSDGLINLEMAYYKGENDLEKVNVIACKYDGYLRADDHGDLAAFNAFKAEIGGNPLLDDEKAIIYWTKNVKKLSATEKTIFDGYLIKIITKYKSSDDYFEPLNNSNYKPTDYYNGNRLSSVKDDFTTVTLFGANKVLDGEGVNFMRHAYLAVEIFKGLPTNRISSFIGYDFSFLKTINNVVCYENSYFSNQLKFLMYELDTVLLLSTLRSKGFTIDRHPSAESGSTPNHEFFEAETYKNGKWAIVNVSTAIYSDLNLGKMYEINFQY